MSFVTLRSCTRSSGNSLAVQAPSAELPEAGGRARRHFSGWQIAPRLAGFAEERV